MSLRVNWGPLPLGQGILAAQFTSFPLVWPLTWELRCWSWAGRGRPTAGAWMPGSFLEPLLGPPPPFPSLADTSLVTPLLPERLFSEWSGGWWRPTASCCLCFSFFVVGHPGDSSVKLHGAATNSSESQRHCSEGMVRESLLGTCPGEVPAGATPSLLVPPPLPPPLSLPPGGCLLSHVGWSWVVS